MVWLQDWVVNYGPFRWNLKDGSRNACYNSRVPHLRKGAGSLENSIRECRQLQNQITHLQRANQPFPLEGVSIKFNFIIIITKQHTTVQNSSRQGSHLTWEFEYICILDWTHGDIVSPVLPFIHESQTHAKNKSFHVRKYKKIGNTKICG